MEYHVIVKNRLYFLTANDLNHMYEQNGWELVSATGGVGQVGTDIIYHFKRNVI